MAYELTGKIKEIFDTQTFPSGFSKREFVVTVADDRFPQDIKLDFLKERVSLLDEFSKGDAVRVSFDIRGREYNGRYFVDLSAWKIAAAGNEAGSASASSAGEEPFPEDTNDYSPESEQPPF